MHTFIVSTPNRKSSLIICCNVDKNLSDTIKYSIISCCHTFSGQKYFKNCAKVGGDLVTMLNLSKSVNNKNLFTFPVLPYKSEVIVTFWNFFKKLFKENRKHKMLMLYLLVSRAFAPTVKNCY